MNKRIKNKHISARNLQRQEKILQELSKVFTIDKKMFGNGYFIFTMGDNAVCHFTLKETPDWKYGIWLGGKDKFKIFGEHVELIDKFKPSRTYVSYENDLSGFISETQKIASSPKLYFVDSLTYGEALVPWEKHEDEYDTWYIGYQVVREFNEESQLWDICKRDESITQQSFVDKEYNRYYAEKAQRLEDEESDRKFAFNFFKELPNMFDEIIVVGIRDMNKHGHICSPRYDIFVVLDNKLSKEDFEKLFTKISELVWEKSREKKTFEYSFSLEGTYDCLSDIECCDYKYFS